MSTHRIDVSGARALTTTTNDPAATAAQVPAKQGDDMQLQLGGFREMRMVLPPNARIERREYVSRSQKVEDGKIVRDENGEIVYQEGTYEHLVLVIPGSVAVFARSSNHEDDENPAKYEGYPHTHASMKRMDKERHFTESGKLLEGVEIGEILPWSEPAEA